MGLPVSTYPSIPTTTASTPATPIDQPAATIAGTGGAPAEKAVEPTPTPEGSTPAADAQPDTAPAG